jgi:hypothetical protein
VALDLFSAVTAPDTNLNILPAVGSESKERSCGAADILVKIDCPDARIERKEILVSITVDIGEITNRKTLGIHRDSCRIEKCFRQ